MRIDEKRLRRLINKLLAEELSSDDRARIDKAREDLKKPLPPGTYKVKGGGTKTFTGTLLNGEVEEVTFTDKDYSVKYKGGEAKNQISFADSTDVLEFGINLSDLPHFEKVSGDASSKKSSGGSSNQKVSDIQKIVGADPDGKWGSNTTEKWKEWISSDEGLRGVAAIVKEKGITLSESKTLNRLQLRNLLERSTFFPYLNEESEEGAPPVEAETKESSAEIPDEVRKYIDTNKGDAAKIAQALGYSGNLSGVDQMAKDVVEKAKSGGAAEGEAGEGETIEASPEEQKKGFLEASRDDSAWAGKRTRDANLLGEKLSKFGDVYGDVPQGGDTSEVNLHGALSREGGCPGLHVSFVRTMDEFKTQHPGETFQDFVQLEIETSRAFTISPASMLKGLFSGDLKGLGFFQGMVDSAIGLNDKNDKTMASFQGFGMETLNFYDGDSSLAGEIFYDSTAKSILYDSSTGDYIMGKILLSDDKEYIYYDQSYSYAQAAEKSAAETGEGGDPNAALKESMIRRKENRKIARILSKYDII